MQHSLSDLRAALAGVQTINAYNRVKERIARQPVETQNELIDDLIDARRRVGGLGYLIGLEAIDVARMTGLALRTPQHRSWEPSDLAPDAALALHNAGGAVYLDLTRLDWIARMRVALARIGAYYFLQWRPQ